MITNIKGAFQLIEGKKRFANVNAKRWTSNAEHQTSVKIGKISVNKQLISTVNAIVWHQNAVNPCYFVNIYVIYSDFITETIKSTTFHLVNVMEVPLFHDNLQVLH